MVSRLKPLRGWLATGRTVRLWNGMVPGMVWLIPAAGALALYFEALQGLVRRWNSDDYSHCYLVPVLSAYLIYQQRERLAGIRNRGPAWPGYPGLAVASLLLFIGVMGSLETFVYLSLWVTVISLVILVWGSRHVRELIFPFLVLLFSVPAPPMVTRMITLKLRLVSSAISVRLLQWFGVSAFREGNIIDLGAVQLQVVDACSGLRYLFPTLIVAIVMGYLLNSRAFHKVVLAALAVPVSITMNALRILTVGLLALNGFPEAAEDGSIHDSLGVLVFLFSIGLLFLFSWGLERSSALGSSPRRPSPQPPPPSSVTLHPSIADVVESPPGAAQGRSRWIHAVAAGAVFLALYLVQGYLSTAQSNVVRKDFSSFPCAIAGWEGRREYLDARTLESLGADDYVTGSFHDRKTGNALQLLVAYYARQTAEHTAHAPTSCLLGGGWILQSRRVLPLEPGEKRPFPIQQMLLNKDSRNILANFWFQQRGRIITDEYFNKFYLLWDSITRSRTDGALVRVEMQLLPGQSAEEAQPLLDDFTAELKKTLGDYIPD